MTISKVEGFEFLDNIDKFQNKYYSVSSRPLATSETIQPSGTHSSIESGRNLIGNSLRLAWIPYSGHYGCDVPPCEDKIIAYGSYVTIPIVGGPSSTNREGIGFSWKTSAVPDDFGSIFNSTSDFMPVMYACSTGLTSQNMPYFALVVNANGRFGISTNSTPGVLFNDSNAAASRYHRYAFTFLSSVVSESQSNFKVEKDTWYDIEIRWRIGTSIEYFINGELIGNVSYSNSDSSVGFVAFGAGIDNNATSTQILPTSGYECFIDNIYTFKTEGSSNNNAPFGGFNVFHLAPTGDILTEGSVFGTSIHYGALSGDDGFSSYVILPSSDKKEVFQMQKLNSENHIKNSGTQIAAAGFAYSVNRQGTPPSGYFTRNILYDNSSYSITSGVGFNTGSFIYSTKLWDRETFSSGLWTTGIINTYGFGFTVSSSG